MRTGGFFSRFCSFFSLFEKLPSFVAMRRLLRRIINRVLLDAPFNPVKNGAEAEIHTEGHRKLVVGLGNPGMEGTRHSVGMAVLGALAARLGVAHRWHGDRHVSGEVILSEVQHTRLVLLRPRLLMNVNGVSVAKAAGKYGIRPEDILLVHDELDKPLGKIAIKHGGSARMARVKESNEVEPLLLNKKVNWYLVDEYLRRRGHNGVRSCVDCLQTDVMLRLRVGIGRPSGKTSVERHVLSRFSSEEQKVLESVLVQSVDLLISQLSPSAASSPAGGRPAAQQRKQKEGRSEDPPAAQI